MSDPLRDPETSGTVRMSNDPFRKPSRRAIVKGAAWAVPAVIAVNAAPAWAASPHDFVPCPSGNIYNTVGRGRLLSGSLLGTNLDTLAAINGITVSNDGHGVVTPSVWGTANPFSPSPVSSDAYAYVNALDVSLLSALGISASLVVDVNTPVGVLNQYGRAVQNGFSAGASGAVTNNGAIQTMPGGGWPVLASLDLKHLIAQVSTAAANLVGAVTNLKLEIGAAAGRATLDACSASSGREYLVSYARLVIGSGLLGQILSLVATVANLPNTTSGPDNLVSFDFQEKTLVVDLGALLAKAYPGTYSNQLNGLAPNTALLINSHVISTLTTAISDTLTNLLTRLLGPLGALVGSLLGGVVGLVNQLVDVVGTLLNGLFNPDNPEKGLLNIVVNAQNDGTAKGPSAFPLVAGGYDVAAVWVTVLNSVANLYLARASVGPNTQTA
ncbi:choice-of-anchor G family protein [Raineyella sp. W15-4]|uniref:choice-of-anchor G family protein n=1 Tax=Raineyella sp. W15-4 TaxID=3081651 RepID=UPI002955BF47|nr:choice-of-anchor G family protein [Raineyella sp. W15-4]WOQ16476.1 choice-of-anchor G family protein [Raineyella sp. W15-4]